MREQFLTIDDDADSAGTILLSEAFKAGQCVR